MKVVGREKMKKGIIRKNKMVKIGGNRGQTKMKKRTMNVIKIVINIINVAK